VAKGPPLLSSCSPRVRYVCPARAGRRTGTAFWVGNDRRWDMTESAERGRRAASIPRLAPGTQLIGEY
jgi:hypothetical protein